ncbi:MAG: hypothetical protein ACLTQR_03755 [Methanobrevibacter smithii]
MTQKNELLGNITTIIKFIVMTIAPYLALTADMQNQLIAVLVAVIGFILAYFDAKHPNTILDNTTNNVEYDNDDTA